jgi:hypothetical protein
MNPFKNSAEYFLYYYDREDTGVKVENISQYNPHLERWEPQKEFRNMDQADMINPFVSILEEDLYDLLDKGSDRRDQKPRGDFGLDSMLPTKILSANLKEVGK